jgi:iron complex outermembrane receptor protein
MVDGMHRKIAHSLCLVCLAAQLVQAEPGSQAEYLEEIETPSEGGDARDENDAALAQTAVVAGLDGASRRRIEEIVVTARKRSELLEETPISVTALSETALRDSNITRLNQITELVPNLQFDEAAGTSTTARVFIRGIGINDTIMTNQPGVGIYIDGVYMARSQGSVLDVVDVAQLEVLRGPQGTLFGKNTAGGAINITTVKPQEQLGGWVQVRPGNFGSLDARLVLDLPIDIGWLKDKLYSRFSFASLYHEGYQYNATRDTYWSDQNTLAFQGALRFLPTDDITIDIQGNYSRNRAKPRGGNCFLIRETDTGGLVPGFFDNCRESEAAEELVFYSDVAGVSDLESYGVWATIEWDLSDLGLGGDLSLKSITAWREQRDRTRRDFDMTASGMIRINIDGGPLVLDGEPFSSQQISQELQALGRNFDGALSWVGGFYYLGDKAHEVSGTDALYSLPFSLPGSASVADRRVDNYTLAVFGQATWNLTDWLATTGGVRWTLDHQGYSMLNWNVADVTETKEEAAGHPIPSEDITQNSRDTEDFAAWTPMVGVAMTLPEDLAPAGLDHLMGYFTWARGFKGGGFNARAGSGFPVNEPLPTFDPEHVNSFEVGIKSVWAERTFTANASFFVAAYEDMQVLTLQSRECEPGSEPGCIIVLPINANAAQATTRGAEFEFMARPLEGLALTWNVGLLDARFNEYQSTNQIDDSPLDRSGERFTNVPQFTTFLALQYSLPVDLAGPIWMRGWITPRIEWYYRSSIDLVGPEITSGDQPGVGLLNARLAWDFLDDQAQVALWARNLTDEIFGTDAIPVGPLGFNSIFYSPPRTWGAELSYRF